MMHDVRGDIRPAGPFALWFIIGLAAGVFAALVLTYLAYLLLS